MLKQAELIGEKFGLLTVIAKDEEKSLQKKRSYWICQCDCGNQKSIRGSSLTSEGIRSCGCLQKKAAAKTGRERAKDLSGQRFGKLVVLKRAGSQDNKATWLCQCDCGNQIIAVSCNLTMKRTQSCGCINFSIGEKNIESCLIKHNINYKKQYQFDDLPKRKFDFAVFDDQQNLIELIEFDGPQHYDPKYNWYSEDQTRRDEEKNEYCKNHNIKLLRIPYKYRDIIDINLLQLGDL